MRDPVRVVAHPDPASHRASESAPRWRWTTSAARPSGARRSSHVASSSCRASLPTRTGGLDQIPVKRTSGGTSSGATARTSTPAAAALAAHSSSARRLTSTAQTRAPGARRARVTATGP